MTKAARPREEKTLAVARLRADPRPTCAIGNLKNKIEEGKKRQTVKRRKCQEKIVMQILTIDGDTCL